MDTPEKQPDVEIINDEPEEQLEPQVVVDLDKKPEVPVQKQEDKPQSQEISKLNNTIAYQTRKLDQAMRELNEMKQRFVSAPQPVQDVPDSQDEIDKIAAKDWKLGVKKLVEPDIQRRIEEALTKREQAQNEIKRRASLESELDNSRKKVLEKYPQIEDSGSEESSLYRQVINEDTSILSNIHGPEIAMYRMEERMRQMGKTPPTVKPMIDREVNRLARAGAASVIGKQASTGGKITLTKEQKEFCDHYNIPYEQYAKNLKADNADGGVQA